MCKCTNVVTKALTCIFEEIKKSACTCTSYNENIEHVHVCILTWQNSSNTLFMSAVSFILQEKSDPKKAGEIQK